jgi:hypothetical protein
MKGGACFVSAFAVTARPVRKAWSARQNDAFETLASSLPPSREIRRRCPGVEHLVVQSVTAAHGVPNRPCGGAVRHLATLSVKGLLVLDHVPRSFALPRLEVSTWARINHWTFVQTTLSGRLGADWHDV